MRTSAIYRLLAAAALMMSAFCTSAHAQVDRRDVRAGNRKFRKEDYRNAEIDYRKGVAKDTLSLAAQYNLASTQYLQGDYEGAGKSLDAVKDVAAAPVGGKSHLFEYNFNRGDVALQKKDYQTAVEAFKKALLECPDDLDAKESYIYAKKKLEDQQQNGGGGQNDQNKDQNQDQNNDQNQNDQNQDNQDQNNQDQNQDKNDQDKDNQDQDGNNQDQNDRNQNNDQGQQPQESKISPQQAQQMLKAIQAKEKDTQDKVKKEKAALLKSRQKEKNW